MSQPASTLTLLSFGLIKLRKIRQFMVRLLFGLSLALLLALPTLIALPVKAAERIFFSFGLLERSVSVASLEAFAEDGRVNSDLASFLRFLRPEQQQELGTALTTTHQLDPVTISQGSYEPMGAEVLRFVGSLLQTGQRQNGLYALRSAMILSAGQPEGFTLLDVLHRFPTNGVRLDLRVALAMLRQGEQFFNETNAVIAGIEQLARDSAPATTVTASDLPDLRQPGGVPFTMQSFTITDARRDHSYPVNLYLPQGFPQSNGADPVRLVVLSHGLGSSRADFADMAKHFASYGFAVALPEHVNSNFDLQQAVLAGRASEVFRVSEFVDRPKDISFLLDELERRNQSEWQSRMNLEEVAVGGHSFGG